MNDYSSLFGYSRRFTVEVRDHDAPIMWDSLQAIEDAAADAAKRHGYKADGRVEVWHLSGKYVTERVEEAKAIAERNGFSPHSVMYDSGDTNCEGYRINVSRMAGRGPNSPLRVDIEGDDEHEVRINGVYTMLLQAVKTAINSTQADEATMLRPDPERSATRWGRWINHPWIAGIGSGVAVTVVTIWIAR